jgi:hypothetical protein
MTSCRQIEANRRNALKSTGPKTEAGKHSSRCNAIRHGLTAETVIGALEDAEDYKAFEAAITADYDAQSAVERELVLRLASILWRLRRATTMETGLFEIQAGHLHDYRQHRELLLSSRDVIHAVFRRPDSSNAAAISHGAANKMETVPSSGKNADSPAVEFARCFCGSPIYPISRSIASVAMKRPFGAKPVGCCTRLKNWTAANRRSGRAVFGSERRSENSTKLQHGG